MDATECEALTVEELDRDMKLGIGGMMCGTPTDKLDCQRMW